jgi:hypothetical protein
MFIEAEPMFIEAEPMSYQPDAQAWFLGSGPVKYK